VRVDQAGRERPSVERETAFVGPGGEVAHRVDATVDDPEVADAVLVARQESGVSQQHRPTLGGVIA
jgi:hypothetical protein